MPGRIFVSYRRQETAWPAGRLYDVLVERFPAEQVFKDVDNIEPGEDFVERITAAVASCDVLLALIGPQWLTMTDENGDRRLDNPEDFVRLEIEAALARKIRVIPILVDGARMPRVNELPPALAPLVRRNAVEISPLTFDTRRLITAVQKTLAEVKVSDATPGSISPPPRAGPDRSDLQGAEAEVGQLYDRALGAFWTEQWDEAVDLLGQVLNRQPDYADAAGKLELARRQQQLAIHRAQASAAAEAGDWEQAVAGYTWIVNADPGSRDSKARLADARQQLQLAILLREARRLHRAGNWAAVIKIGDQLQAIDPAKADPDGLMTSARAELAAEQQAAKLAAEYHTALRLFDAGRWHEAVKALERVTQLDPAYQNAQALLDRARQELGRAAPSQAEGLARQQAEGQGTQQAEAQEQARRQAEERARGEAEQKAKREAEERARGEAEQKAKREAQERARGEAEHAAEARPNAVARPGAVAAARRPSRSTGYFATIGVLAILGILLAFLGPESPVTAELTWDVDSHSTQAGADLPEGTTGLSPTLLGLDLPESPIPLDVDANTFDIGRQRLFLAGPAIAEFDPSGESVRLVRSGGSWWLSLLTIPGVVMVLGALFSFVYGESLLRLVRKRRGTVRTGELVGMAGVGAVLGGVITVAGWIAGNVPTAAGVLGVVLCLTAAAGLLPYAVATLPQHRGVVLAAVPLAFLGVLSITWTAVGISGGGQGDVTTTPSDVTTPPTPTPSPTKTTTPPVPLLKWRRGTDLPEPLEAAGVTVFGDAVWVVGGNAPSAGRPKLDKVWFYRNGWQPGPKLPVRLDSMPVASDGKRLFVVGGQTSDSNGRNPKDSREVWVLNGPDDDSWEMLDRLPEERSGGAVAWDGQRLVFAGGLNHRDLNGDGKAESVNHANVWVWEGKGKWREIGQLQRQREDLVAASDGNGRVWFLGGADVGKKVPREPTGAVDLVEDDRITPLSDIDPVRSSAAVWLADRGVCLFGGVAPTHAKTSGSPTSRVVCVPETASPSRRLRPLPPLTGPRAGEGAAVLGETIWLVGGFGHERKDEPFRQGLSVVEVLAL